VNDRGFVVQRDGSYSIVLSATPHEGNWLRLDPAAHAVVVRSYFQLKTSAQNDPAIGVDIAIEPLEPTPPSAPLSDAVLADRMREGIAFLRQATLGQRLPSTPISIPFIATEANTLPKPFSFRDSGLPVPGAADIFYASGRWDLADDEALLITGTLPRCAFANVMLWNRHMQTLEYCVRRSSINHAQMALEPDGSFRIVVAHTDPGVPNWLDTEGHVFGTIFWRILLPEEDPPQMACTVVPIASLRAG
jgi:hypothetical protein